MERELEKKEFNQEELLQVKEILSKYPEKQAAIMPVLYLWQDKNGWISGEGMEYIAGLLNVSVEHVLGVVTFYSMYNTKPVGKYHLQICTNVSCMLRGAYQLMDDLKEQLKINKGETTPDSLFTLEEVECLGSCGTAPVIQINKDYIENLNKEKLTNIINQLSTDAEGKL